MAGPPKKTPSKQPPDFLAAAIQSETKSMIKRMIEEMDKLFSDGPITEAVKADLDTLAASVPASVAQHYMPIGGMYVYGGSPMFCSSGGVNVGGYYGGGQDSSTLIVCRVCREQFKPWRFMGGEICRACSDKVDKVLAEQRELSPDEVGAALSEFLRKKLATVEDVGAARTRGIDLEDDKPKP